MNNPMIWQQTLAIALITVLGFCLIVGVITVMRWPWYRGHVLPGGVDQMDYQIGPLTHSQLKALYYETLMAIDAKGHANWNDIQAGVANARMYYPASQ